MIFVGKVKDVRLEHRCESLMLYEGMHAWQERKNGSSIVGLESPIFLFLTHTPTFVVLSIKSVTLGMPVQLPNYRATFLALEFCEFCGLELVIS